MDICNADHLFLGGRVRNEDDIILILSHGRLPLRGQQPDHSEGHVFDLHHLPHRNGHSRMLGYSMPVPCSVVAQFSLAYTTWVTVRNVGVAKATAEHSF